MKDVDFFARIPGLEAPWSVENVVLNTNESRVDIRLQHESHVAWACPECGLSLPCRDHSEERTWRHLDTCQFKTFLHARIPWVDCPEHGVRQVSIPWAEPRSRLGPLVFSNFLLPGLVAATQFTRSFQNRVFGICRLSCASAQTSIHVCPLEPRR